MVVHELFATDTVDYADIVLPATSQLEHVDIHGSYGHLDVMYNPPTIAPRGDCRSNNDVFRLAGTRLEFEAELFPDDETLIRQLLDGGPTLQGITLERLKDEGSVRLDIPECFAPFAEGVFPTPSGKCELYSEQMKANGLDPVPTYLPPHEDPQRAPTWRPDIRCSLSARPGPSFSTRRSPIPPAIVPRRATPRSSSRLKTRGRAGSSAGEWAEVYNDRGRFQARVALTESVRSGVAVATGIYWNKLTPGGGNVNNTTSSALTDMGGGATFFDNMVEVRHPLTPPRRDRLSRRPNAEYPEKKMPSLLTRLWPRIPRAEHLTFIVYTRAQCCCCHEALDMLKNAQERFGFVIEEVDVDGDPNLVAQFDTDVPVVALNGKVRFRGMVNPCCSTGCFRSESRTLKRNRLFEHAPHGHELAGMIQRVHASHQEGRAYGGRPGRERSISRVVQIRASGIWSSTASVAAR